MKDQLIVVANRLPIRRTVNNAGETVWSTSPGGLTSALSPAMSNSDDVTWIGWPGNQQLALNEPFISDGVKLVPIEISDQEYEDHYEGMSNATLWPLYHDKVQPARFHRSWFEGYKSVNQKFADAILDQAKEGATVWIHDYQLQLVPQLVKSVRPDLAVGFFLHIPFPAPEIFSQLPWRSDIVNGLLGSDLIGFQTPDYTNNFKRLLKQLKITEQISGSILELEDRSVCVESFPIGFDFDKYEESAKKPEVKKMAEKLRKQMGNPKTIFLGVDRLDYTKGIDVRLRAYKELIQDSRIDADSVTMIQVAPPSRDNVKAYENLRSEVERQVGNINGRFSNVGVPTIQYITQNQSVEELSALYQIADVMMVTPFRDGMNLVALEYVASRFNETGSLILSEFAGASHILNDALMVNPYSINEIKEAMVKATQLSEVESKTRMKHMRAAARKSKVNVWVNDFLSSLETQFLSSSNF